MTVALVASAASGLATGLGALPFVFVRELPRRVYDGVLGLGEGLVRVVDTLGLARARRARRGVRGSLPPAAPRGRPPPAAGPRAGARRARPRGAPRAGRGGRA